MGKTKCRVVQQSISFLLHLRKKIQMHELPEQETVKISPLFLRVPWTVLVNYKEYLGQMLQNVLEKPTAKAS